MDNVSGANLGYQRGVEVARSIWVGRIDWRVA